MQVSVSTFCLTAGTSVRFGSSSFRFFLHPISISVLVRFDDSHLYST